MVKFIHAADIHLDSPLHRLEEYDGAPVEEIRRASRRAFEKLMDLALDESVDFVLIAGDLFDGDWKDYNTGLYFVSQVRRLRDEDIQVFIVSGNHDAFGQMTRRLPYPDNVHTFSHGKPETRILGALCVVLSLLVLFRHRENLRSYFGRRKAGEVSPASHRSACG